MLRTPRSLALGPRRTWVWLGLLIASVLQTLGFAQQDPSPPNPTQLPAIGSTPSIGTALTDPNNPIAQLFGSERLDLWSLQPIRAPRIPDSTGHGQSHPIDRFLAVPLSGIQPVSSDMVSKKDRLERLSLDLIGLRASYDEVQDFESDESSDSFMHQIDRLLADLLLPVETKTGL
jgi:hypothetical protein